METGFLIKSDTLKAIGWKKQNPKAKKSEPKLTVSVLSRESPLKDPQSHLSLESVDNQAKHSSKYLMNYLLSYICFSSQPDADRSGMIWNQWWYSSSLHAHINGREFQTVFCVLKKWIDSHYNYAKTWKLSWKMLLFYTFYLFIFLFSYLWYIDFFGG